MADAVVRSIGAGARGAGNGAMAGHG